MSRMARRVMSKPRATVMQVKAKRSPLATFVQAELFWGQNQGSVS